MALCIYEDRTVNNLRPLTDTRAVYELLCGTSTLLTKIRKGLSEDMQLYLFTRPYLRMVLQERYPEAKVNVMPSEDELLFVNGSLVMDEKVNRLVSSLKKGEALTVGGEIVAALINGRMFSHEWVKSLMGGDPKSVFHSLITSMREVNGVNLITYPWQLIELSVRLIPSEASGKALDSPNIYGQVVSRGEVSLEGHVLVDGRRGPVVLDDNVVVEPFSKIVGPAYIGPNSVIFTGSVVSECSIGPVCRIGGEVESSIFIGYSNKRHYGYVGHSIVGEWVNMGAGTTVSNLKNTYGTFRLNISGQRVDSGRQFMGSFFGDHVKTSIGCMVSGGLSIGVSSHIYRYVNTDVPAFTIYFPDTMTEIFLESALSTAKRMMMRRQVTPSEEYLNMLEYLFHATAEERSVRGVKKGKASFYNSQDKR